MQTTDAALKVTTRPVIISHTGLDTQLGNNPSIAQMMRPRLISKEQAKMVANAGGLVGVWTHLADSPLAYARNVRALVDVIGVEHVCIGTDTKLTQPSPRPIGPVPGAPAGGSGSGQQRPRVGERTNQAWQDQTVGFYYVVVDAMLRTGFTPDEIGKIGGGNVHRSLILNRRTISSQIAEYSENDQLQFVGAVEPISNEKSASLQRLIAHCWHVYRYPSTPDLSFWIARQNEAARRQTLRVR